MYSHHFRHLGRHLEFLKMLNDDRLSSSRIMNGNVFPTRIHQEKNFIPDFQVHRKNAIFVPEQLMDLEYMINLGQGHLLTLTGLSSIHTFQRFFSLKPLGQSKPNFI